MYKKNIKSLVGRSFKRMLFFFRTVNNFKFIFLYHRVVEELPDGIHDPAMFVTMRTFEEHIRELKKSFEIVPLEMIVHNGDKSRRLCAITFDDGWSDNYDYAFPILKKYKVPATIFLTANLISTKKTFWFENLLNIAKKSMEQGRQIEFIEYFRKLVPSWKARGLEIEQLYELTDALKKLPSGDLDGIMHEACQELGISLDSNSDIMNWDQIREMSEHGVMFGSHGLNHCILTRLDTKNKTHEIVDSLTILKKAGIAVTPFFSYPNGDWDDEALDIVRNAGYKGAVTTRLGLVDSETNPHRINRIGVHEDISSSSSLLWFRIAQAALGRS
jgi:peptidoglycan/xylan/chitin deacetylase (PgdA/CDA1 family)